MLWGGGGLLEGGLLLGGFNDLWSLFSFNIYYYFVPWDDFLANEASFSSTELCCLRAPGCNKTQRDSGQFGLIRVLL